MVEHQAIEWYRWLIYLMVGAPLVVWIFLTRDNALRVLALVVMLIFVQDSLTARRFFFGVGIGPALMIVSTVLVAYLLERGRLPALSGYGWFWTGFLFFALVGLVNGSLGTGLLFFNIRELQLIYLEGFLVFLVGYMAFRSDEEIDRFFRYFIFAALGVALAHFFTLATGYRFPGSRAHLGHGVLFQTENHLASFYVIVIPIYLAMALRGKISLPLRLSVFVTLTLMGASLFLSGSRGGMLLLPVMGVAALFWSRLGIGRGLLAGAITMLGLISVYWFITTFLPTFGEETVRAFEQEGLRTNRPEVWKAYLKIILDHPFGVGLAPENIILVLSRYGTAIRNAHNIYLNIAVATGISGLIVFMAMMATLVRRVIRAMSRAETELQRQVLMYPLIAVIGFLVAGFIEPIYTLAPKLNQFFWLMAGISAAASARVLAGDGVLKSGVASEPTAHDPGGMSNDGRNEISPWGIR